MTSSNMETALKRRGVRGDDLLNATDLANALKEKNGIVSDDGIATLYHRTTPENAKAIVKEQRMTSKEDGLFFGTRPAGSIEGYGEAVVRVEIPVEKLQLDDEFPQEYHVRMPTGAIGKKIPVRASAMSVDKVSSTKVVLSYLKSTAEDNHGPGTYKVSKALQGLAAEAMKYDTFDEFEKAFLVEIKHGTYWHWTDDPNFTIDKEKGPRDMSSLSTGKMTKGALMITSDFRYWSTYGPGEKGRPYAALIDMSDVPKEAYYQVKRGFGNEFYVSDPSRARVTAVYPRARAFQVDSERKKMLPQSSEELEMFYNKVREGTKKPQ